MKKLYLRVFREIKGSIVYLALAILSILIVVPVTTYVYFAKDLQDKERIINRNDIGISLFDQNNKLFFNFYNAKNETYAPLSSISIFMQKAVIAAEDRNFYQNPGFSIQGIFRAFFVNLMARRIEEGGSTITQQLVKISLLNPKRDFIRKYQEVVLAYEINRRYSKNEILEMYLNSAYFGEGAFGAESAAKIYFNKNAKDLTLGESSLLIGLLPAPSALSPLSNNPSRAKEKQKIVLREMTEMKLITKEQANFAYSQPLEYNINNKEINVLAPHFALMVRDTLIKEYGEEFVARSGFKVKTTLNREWQIYAENVAKTYVEKLKQNNASNGAIVVVSPQTGEIKVMVGSIDWYNTDFGKFNMAIAPRSPGSSFKPIIYANAFERKLITPATILQDKPTTFPINYQPQNYDRRFRGAITVRKALANSLNVPAVEVMQRVGIENGIEMAHRLGITTLNNPSDFGLALALGAGEVKLLDLTGVYSVFANSGIKNAPTAILEVKDKYDNVIYAYEPKPERVMGEDVAYLISSILSDNNARVETFGNLLTINREAAVKTGTAENYRDSLTMGYVPNLAIGVWVGNNDNSPMDNVAGSIGAAPIWKDLMEHFSRDLPFVTFQKPDSVISCYGLKTSSTSASLTEYFIAGTQPSSGCTLPTTPPIPSPTSTISLTPTISVSSPTSTLAPTPKPVAPTVNPTNTPTIAPSLTLTTTPTISHKP